MSLEYAPTCKLSLLRLLYKFCLGKHKWAAKTPRMESGGSKANVFLAVTCSVQLVIVHYQEGKETGVAP